MLSCRLQKLDHIRTRVDPVIWSSGVANPMVVCNRLVRVIVVSIIFADANYFDCHCCVFPFREIDVII